jgi:hypothetical protein
MVKIAQFFEKWPKTVTKRNDAKIQTMFKKAYLDENVINGIAIFGLFL